MKLPLLAGIVFLATLGGGTTASVLLRPAKSAAPADSIAVPDTAVTEDSVHVALTASSAVPSPAPAPVSVPVPAADSTHAATAGPAHPEPARGDSTSPPKASAPPPIDRDRDQRVKRLARIFSGMKSEDAAEVMANLGEAEALEVLLRLDPRAAASILSGLPKDRAITLSRRMLAPRVKESIP